MLASFTSMLSLNNETVNIYTHLVGGLVFALLPSYFYHYFYLTTPTAEPLDVVVFSIYLGGVSVCFFLSAL